MKGLLGLIVVIDPGGIVMSTKEAEEYKNNK